MNEERAHQTSPPWLLRPMLRETLSSRGSAVIGIPVQGIAVVVLNWNGWADTIECLESLLRLDPGPQQVVVCDNASEDDSIDHLMAWAEGRLNVAANMGPLHPLSFPPVEKPIPYEVYNRSEAEAGCEPSRGNPRLVFIRAGANLGFAGGNNVGLRYLLSNPTISAVWILNNDTVVDKKALGAVISEVRSNPAAGLIGATVLEYDRPDVIQAQAGARYLRCIGLGRHLGARRNSGRALGKQIVSSRVDYIFGASMFVTRQFLEEVGLMNERYFLYYEELDWAIRARGRSALGYAADAIVYHKIGRSIGTCGLLAGSALSLFYMSRNRLLIARCHWPHFVLTTTALNLAVAGFLLVKLRLREAIAVLRATAAALGKPLEKAFRSSF